MYAGHFTPMVCKSEAESEFGDTLGLGPCDNFEGFDDARNGLVLQAGIFALGVFSNDAEIDVVMSSLVAGDVLDENDRRVDVELLP